MSSNGQPLEPVHGAAIVEAALSLCAMGGLPIFPHRDTIPAASDRPPNGNEVVRAPGGSRRKRKRDKKPRCPRRDTQVPFDEMSRLMRVYGPIRCQRDRTKSGAESRGSPTKPDSIRRKFYRWFPDFAQRFEEAEDGRFAPRAGHQREMEYREGLRKLDEGRLKGRLTSMTALAAKTKNSKNATGDPRPEISLARAVSPF